MVTVQLRFNGWVTEMQDPVKMKEIYKDLSGRQENYFSFRFSSNFVQYFLDLLDCLTGAVAPLLILLS